MFHRDLMTSKRFAKAKEQEQRLLKIELLHSHHLLVGFVSKSGPRLFTLYLSSPQLYVDHVFQFTQITPKKCV